MNVLLVALGAAVGAPLRYLADRSVQRLTAGATFPWGTWCVNVAGSFVLGLVTAASWTTSGLTLLLGTGFCGALTTYSTFSFETVRLARIGAWRTAAAYVALSLAAGLGAAELGALLA